MDHASLARQTLDGLEERLQRLRLTIFGNVSQGDEIRPSGTQRVGSRIHSLEKALEAFEAQSSSIRDLLRLSKIGELVVFDFTNTSLSRQVKGSA